MSHDYDPSWDYPTLELSKVENLTAAEKDALTACIERVRKDLAPALQFEGESTFEVFFAEPMGLHGAIGSEVVAIYCNGTSSRPVIGFDLYLMKQVSEDEDLNWLHQFELSLAHELGHAYQETLGLDHEDEHGFDEDDAEAFGIAWADHKEINLWLLDPEAPRPVSPKP